MREDPTKLNTASSAHGVEQAILTVGVSTESGSVAETVPIVVPAGRFSSIS